MGSRHVAGGAVGNVDCMLKILPHVRGLTNPGLVIGPNYEIQGSEWDLQSQRQMGLLVCFIQTHDRHRKGVLGVGEREELSESKFIPWAPGHTFD